MWWGNTASELLHFFVHVCHLEQQEVVRITELYERLGMTSLGEFRQHVNSKILQTIGISPHSTEHILACLSKSCSVQESLHVTCAKGTPMTPDGFYIDTPTPHDAKTPETLFERNPASFMGAEEFQRDLARDHLGSPKRIELVGSEVMFTEDIESMTEPAPRESATAQLHQQHQYHQQQQQQDHVSIDYSPLPLDGPPPLRIRDRFKVEQSAFDSFRQASPKDSPVVPGGLTCFKYISFPPNPCIVYRDAIKRCDNWPQSPPPLDPDPQKQTGRGAVVLLGSSRSIYNASLEQGTETVTALADVVHKQHTKAQWAVRSDCPSDCPYSGYCSFAGVACPKVSPSHDGTPCPRLSQIKAMCRRLSRPQSAPKARTPEPPNCALRRVVSNCTLEEMERGGCCQTAEPSSSSCQDGGHSDGSEADDDDVLNLSHNSNHDSARVKEDCPRPLAPSDVEMLCKPMQTLTPTSRNVGLGFGWLGQSSASSSTSTASELSASLSSLLASGRAAEVAKRGLESARESLSDEMSLPVEEEVEEEEEEEEEEDGEENEEEEKKQGDVAVVPWPLLVPPPAAPSLPVQQQQDEHRELQEANHEQDQNPASPQCVKYCQCRNCRRSLWEAKAKCTLS